MICSEGGNMWGRTGRKRFRIFLRVSILFSRVLPPLVSDFKTNTQGKLHELWVCCLAPRAPSFFPKHHTENSSFIPGLTTVGFSKKEYWPKLYFYEFCLIFKQFCLTWIVSSSLYISKNCKVSKTWPGSYWHSNSMNCSVTEGGSWNKSWLIPSLKTTNGITDLRSAMCQAKMLCRISNKPSERRVILLVFTEYNITDLYCLLWSMGSHRILASNSKWIRVREIKDWY